MQTPDLLVLGAGPAGLSLAAKAAERGLRVRLMAPDLEARWEQSWGSWEDELGGLSVPVAQRWAAPTVRTPAGGERVLGRRYARIDTPALQRQLQEAALEAGVTLQLGRAADLRHDARGAEVLDTDGRRTRATVVVDASGHQSPFVRREGQHAPGFQMAWGERVEVADHPWLPGEMVLMDVTPAGSDDPTEDPAPSFLYAMPESRNVVFVEETSLVRRPPLSLEMLEYRLHARMRRMGVEVRRVLGVERCRITMGGGVPRTDQRVVGFGAAGAMVHPATGYMLASVLSAAPKLADALVQGLDGGDPTRAARFAWRALWPARRLRSWELYQFGMDAICRMDAAELGSFLDAFYTLEQPTWAAFLSGTLSPDEVRRAMAGVFRHADGPLRRRLIDTGTSPAVVSLFRSLWAA